MKEEYFIGVDCSTQSTKALMFDVNGHLVKQAKVGHTLQSLQPGWAEQEPKEWWSALCNVLQELTSNVLPEWLRGIGISYQRETFVAIDQSGQEIRPAILWLDQRSGTEVEELKNDLGTDFFRETTGKLLDTVPSLPKIKWVKNQEPENYQRIDKLCDVGAYLNWKLTGTMVSPCSGADTSGILDIKAKCWSEDILHYLELSADNMPEIVPAGMEVGKISRKAAECTGLPAGLPVIAAGGDGQVFAVGVHSINEEDMALTLGTGVAWGVHSATYRNSPYYRTMIGCIPESYYYESVLISGSHTVSWFVDTMGSDEREVAKLLNCSPESLFEQAIEKIPPGCEGLLTGPYWKGRMMPHNNPHARGLTVGWSDYHTRAHFYRSILEGIAFELRVVNDGYHETLGIRPKMFRIGSGGAESALWTQIVSDVTNMSVVVSESTENTALGAAMITAWGLGYYPTLEDASNGMYKARRTFIPNPEHSEIYSRLYDAVYKHLYPAIWEYLKILGDFALRGEILL